APSASGGGSRPYTGHDDANATLSAPASAAAVSTLTVPRTFASASASGSSRLPGTDVKAARWKTRLASAKARLRALGSRIEPFTTVTRSLTPARFWSRPTVRSSRATTSFLPARRPTRWDPMNPPPPVTATRFPRSIGAAEPRAAVKGSEASGPSHVDGAVRGHADDEVLGGEHVLRPRVLRLRAADGVEVPEPPRPRAIDARVQRHGVRVHPEGGEIERGFGDRPGPRKPLWGAVHLQRGEIRDEPRRAIARRHEGRAHGAVRELPPGPPLFRGPR